MTTFFTVVGAAATVCALFYALFRFDAWSSGRKW